MIGIVFVSVCVFVCVYGVCVCERERESKCVWCVCVRERERVSVCGVCA